MKQRWQRIRPVMWALTPIVGVAMLFLLPWLVRELRPLSSDALFQEARAELGAARARYAHAAAFRSEWHRGSEYRYTLLVRAESPGEYTILPAHLWGMYAPYQAHSNPFRIRIAAR